MHPGYNAGSRGLDTDLLYYGDNLEILRKYVVDESVDLVYLDPPFNSNRDYKVIFKNEAGRKSDAELLAFEDTWHWGPAAKKVLRLPHEHSAAWGSFPVAGQHPNRRASIRNRLKPDDGPSS